MSYILDALKKSEKERQLQKVPDLLSTPGKPSGHRPSRWLWLLSLALVMNAAVFAWWFFAGRGQAPNAGRGEAVLGERAQDAGAEKGAPIGPAGGDTPAPQERPAAPVGVPDVSAKTAPPPQVARGDEGAPPPRLLGPAAAANAVPLSVPAAAPAPEPVAGESAEPAPAEETMPGDEEILAGQEPGEIGEDAGPEAMPELEPPPGGVGEEFDGDTPPVAPESATPGADTSAETAAVPEFSGLPPSIRREIPELSISIHLFSEDPARRKVGINGRMRRQGEGIAEGLLLEEITEDGVILSWKGKRFHLGVF